MVIGTLIRILTLALSLCLLASCGRSSSSANDPTINSSKQDTSTNFLYQRRIPLLQVQDLLFQENMGSMKTRFALSQRPHQNQSFMSVKVNDVAMISGYHTDGSDIVFDRAPTSASKISVNYDPENLRGALALKTIVLPSDLDLSTISATFNDRGLGLAELKMSRNENGELLLNPGAIVFDLDDSYEIINFRGLNIELTAVHTGY